MTTNTEQAVERIAQGLKGWARDMYTVSGIDEADLAMLHEAADTLLSLLSQEAKKDREAVAWQAFDAIPDVGRKFIALFNDGSGAAMFWRHDCGYIDADGNETETLGSSYDRWAYLPDDLDFWCEGHPEEPVILRLPPALSEGEAS